MAVEDYKKLMPKIAKWHVDQSKDFKDGFADVDKARVMALKADHWLAAKKPAWAKIQKDLLAKNKTWLTMAEEIARLQKEVAAAKKSKNKDKIKSLELDIKKIDSHAKRVVQEFHVLYDKVVQSNQELIKVTRALQNLKI